MNEKAINEAFDVFISAKSEDYNFATEVYEYLVKHEYTVFFSKVSIPSAGISDYRKLIDEALDNSTHMVVVTRSKENVTSPWVEAEWGLFVNEKRSGRKKGNIISLICKDMTIDQLPASLRNLQVLPLSSEGLSQLPNFLPHVYKGTIKTTTQPARDWRDFFLNYKRIILPILTFIITIPLTYYYSINYYVYNDHNKPIYTAPSTSNTKLDNNKNDTLNIGHQTELSINHATSNSMNLSDGHLNQLVNKSGNTSEQQANTDNNNQTEGIKNNIIPQQDGIYSSNDKSQNSTRINSINHNSTNNKTPNINKLFNRINN